VKDITVVCNTVTINSKNYFLADWFHDDLYFAFLIEDS